MLSNVGLLAFTIRFYYDNNDFCTMCERYREIEDEVKRNNCGRFGYRMTERDATEKNCYVNDKRKESKR